MSTETQTTLAQDCKALRAIKQARDAAKSEFDDLDSSFKSAQAELMKRMEHEGVDSLKAEGTLFVPAETEYATVQDRDAFVAWANDNDEGLVELKERKDLLNQLVREKLDNGEELPPGVGFYVRSYVSQRAA